MDWKSSDTAPTDGTWILIRARNSIDKPTVPIVAAYKSGGAVGTSRTDHHIAWRSSETGDDLTNYMADGWDWTPLPDWRAV